MRKEQHNKEQDKEVLINFFGKDVPISPEHAMLIIGKSFTNGCSSLSPELLLALENLHVSGMGKKISPKKHDRRVGEERRRKRTGQ